MIGRKEFNLSEKIYGVTHCGWCGNIYPGGDTECCCTEGTQDPNTANIIRQHRERAKIGLQKYGKTTADNPLSLYEWLEHAKQEAMDFAIYCEAAQRKIKENKNKNDINS